MIEQFLSENQDLIQNLNEMQDDQDNDYQEGVGEEDIEAQDEYDQEDDNQMQDNIDGEQMIIQVDHQDDMVEEEEDVHGGQPQPQFNQEIIEEEDQLDEMQEMQEMQEIQEEQQMLNHAPQGADDEYGDEDNQQ